MATSETRRRLLLGLGAGAVAGGAGARGRTSMHVVLAGDSVFDNAAYVPGGPAVIEQVRAALPAGAHATLLAVDGSVLDGVARQLARLPAAATHLVISSGGNDALGQQGILREQAGTVEAALRRLAAMRDAFAVRYEAMLRQALSHRLPVAVCTIYDAVPGLDRASAVALNLFNDVITRAAYAAGVPVIDLRVICAEAQDYSARSPIEPSVQGGAKIARAIARTVSRSS
jgi:hypothetical protein